ncbi:MarR family winged helix-turn-helix transcriptional regulator [Streptomyces sp. WMMC1477]|uniref:MarR family winged helix-turn-helix transcriptional regulator n=1 Tax=Streptomyces sp. WMMC1477 TaxID=3015155 RepID=UPI0022B6F3B6|nr:MarR family transcriptional regulator [Streptomyces sp. WMMC1477]MCZ7434383.1 MarR family transcriptional regulator [Streptomyces sp. WMMC1477]
MTTRDPLEDTELTLLLGLAFQSVLTEFTARLEAAGHHGLRPVHGMLLQALKASPATSTELADHLGVTKQAAGQIVDGLERRGYVERLPHPAGGRRKLVALTPRAEEHLRVAGQVLHELEAELADRLAGAGLDLPRTELAAIVRGLSGERVPPLRPGW